MTDLLAVLGPQGAFGELQRNSGRLLNEVSHAQIRGAQNLLTKAVHSLARGDDLRAQRLIDRAAQMPYDPREEGSPGVRAASILVYGIICEQFEDSDEDDAAWLDVVLAVHPHLDATGQAEVSSVAHGFVLQDAFFSPTPAEARRIRRAFGDAPLEADLGDGPDVTVEQRIAIIRSLTTAAAALREAYLAASGNP